MAVLVYTEHEDGKVKRSSYELTAYASELAKQFNAGPVVAVSFGNIADSELATLGKVGAEKVINFQGEGTDQVDPTLFFENMKNVLDELSPKFVVFGANNSGRALAPLVSAYLKYGLVPGVVELPREENGKLIFKKNAYSGKAFADYLVNTEGAVIMLMRNSFDYELGEGNAQVEVRQAEGNKAYVIEKVEKATGKVPLTEADVVVSGGRGMKGPENWYLLEELAEELGAALACSKPVSDMGWRPHTEHVGQTGLTIRPTLYIAVGISGAIQHLAGVSGSRYIVAINKDPEAPIFKACDYGVVGDLFEVVPKLTQAIREFKKKQAGG